MLSQDEAIFLGLAKELEELQEKMSEKRARLEEVMMKLDYDAYVQDLNTLAVYKIYEPAGTFVAFRHIDYKRTNLPGEKGGGGTVLSKKEAEEAGFTLTR